MCYGLKDSRASSASGWCLPSTALVGPSPRRLANMSASPVPLGLPIMHRHRQLGVFGQLWADLRAEFRAALQAAPEMGALQERFHRFEAVARSAGWFASFASPSVGIAGPAGSVASPTPSPFASCARPPAPGPQQAAPPQPPAMSLSANVGAPPTISESLGQVTVETPADVDSSAGVGADSSSRSSPVKRRKLWKRPLKPAVVEIDIATSDEEPERKLA